MTVETGVLGANQETIVFTPQERQCQRLFRFAAGADPDDHRYRRGTGCATLNTPSSITFANARVGTVESQAISVTNSATAPAASLDATVSAYLGATASGTISKLAPGATDATDLSVGLNTSTSGLVAGLVAVGFKSNSGSGVTAPLPGQTVEVSGAVYQPGTASIAPVTAYVGSQGTQALSIANTDAADGYSENLIATVVGTTGGVTASGTTGDIAPQATSNAIALGFSTASAGVPGTVTLDLQSRCTASMASAKSTWAT